MDYFILFLLFICAILLVHNGVCFINETFSIIIAAEIQVYKSYFYRMIILYITIIIFMVLTIKLTIEKYNKIKQNNSITKTK